MKDKKLTMGAVVQGLEDEIRALEDLPKSEQGRIKIPKIVQAGVIGKNGISINGQLYQADTKAAGPGELVMVTNTGRPAAAKYERIRLGDVIANISAAAGIDPAQSMRDIAANLKLTVDGQIRQALDNLAGIALGKLREPFAHIASVAVIIKGANIEFDEQAQRAAESLGIDLDKPSAYDDMLFQEVLTEAENARQIEQLIRSVNPSTARMLLGRFLKQTEKRGVGRQDAAGYDLAFVRWHIKGTHSQSQAFEAYIDENNISLKSESDKASRWYAFKASLKSRRRDYEKGNTKLLGRISKLL